MSIITQGLGANTLITRGYGGYTIVVVSKEIYLQSALNQNNIVESKIIQIILLASAYMIAELLVSNFEVDYNFESFIKEITFLFESELANIEEFDSEIAREFLHKSNIAQENRFDSGVSQDIHFESRIKRRQILDTSIASNDIDLESRR